MSANPNRLEAGRGGAGTLTSSRLPSRPITSADEKWCSRCREVKPLAEFSTKRSNPDGLQRWCRDCRNADQKDRADRRSEEEREYFRDYYREWKEKNHDSVLAYNRNLYRENDEYRARVLAQSAALSDRKRRERITILGFLKGEVGCVSCGMTAPVGQLQFHHVDPTTKSFEVGSRLYTAIDVIAAEVRKCVVMCLMCHANYHRRTLEVPKADLEKGRSALAKLALELPRLDAEQRALRKPL